MAQVDYAQDAIYNIAFACSPGDQQGGCFHAGCTPKESGIHCLPRMALPIDPTRSALTPVAQFLAEAASQRQSALPGGSTNPSLSLRPRRC